MAQTEGDVAARVLIRFDEALESLRLIRTIIDDLPDGAIAVPFTQAREHQLGLGMVEGWRGPVLVALTSGPEGASGAVIRTILVAQLAGAGNTRSSATSFPISR